MARQLDFEVYQPQPFCKINCPNMYLKLGTEDTMYADQTIYDRIVTIHCEHEAVCKAARSQMHDECVQAILSSLKLVT